MIDQKFIQTKLTHQMRKAECSGNPAITNNKCINSTLADYKAYGNSEQDDCGENLLNITMTPTTISGITCTKLDSGFYQFTGTSTAIATFSSVIISTNRKLFKAGTYYLPYPIPANVQLILNFYTASSNGNLTQIYINQTQRTFTINQDLYLSKWIIKILSADTAYDFSFFPQITKEDITERKAYVSAPTPDTLSEIRSVGDKVLDGYNTDNISLWLDGELNTRNGHNASSTNWEDLSGNNFDFTIGNLDATFNDYALNFAHKGHSGAVSCTADILGTSKSITIEVCSHLLTDDTNYYWIFSNRGNGSKGFQFLNAINVDSYKNKSAFRQSLFLNGNTGDYVVTFGITRDRSNTYPITYQAITIEENRIKFYIDGELVQTYNKTLTDDEWGYLRQKYFYIGHFGSGYYYFGDIHSIRVHQTALTDGELKRNAEIDLNRFNNKISATKYEIPISISSNLLEFQATSNTVNGLTYDLTEDGVLTLNGTTTSSVSIWQNFTNADKLLKGKYSIRIFKEGTITGWRGFGGVFTCWESYNEVDRYIYINSDLSQNIYLSQDRLLNRIGIYFYPNVTFDNVKLKIMLVKGGKIPDEYIPYTEPETKFIYLDEPLRAIGEYKDYIDFRQGKVIRNIAALSLKAEQLTYLSTYWYSTKNMYAIGFNKSKISMLLSINTKITLCMMEHYPDLHANPNRAGFTSSQNEGYVFIFRTDFDGTLAQAQELVAGENIIYVLATPTEETIDLPKLPQFKGTTVYTIDTETDGEFWCRYKYRN